MLRAEKKKLFIYIPTYKRPFWLEKQLDKLAPQLLKYSGKVRVLVNHNSVLNPEFEAISKKFSMFKDIEFRCNPANILANANITLGFVFVEQDDFLWILSDDDIITEQALDEIFPALLTSSDIVHMGNYESYQTLDLNLKNVFTVTEGAGLGLISVVIFRMDFIRNHLFNGFEYIESSFPHLAITLSALREYGTARMNCIKAVRIFAFEGALSDGDYSQSKLGYSYLVDFFPRSEGVTMAWAWLLNGWRDFLKAKDSKTPLNNKSRFYKASGHLNSLGVKFKVFLLIASCLYKGKKMLQKMSQFKNSLKYRLNKFMSLGNNGERLDMKYNKDALFEDLDVYEKSHVNRYKYAQKIIPTGLVVGDFACGTGYGSVILSETAKEVNGVDISKKTIQEVKKRYRAHKNINFINQNLLELKFENYFDYIVSFETVEHLEENLIPPVFKKFHQALKPGGKLILSTPYMQETPPPEVPLNYHLTHEIDEKKIESWLATSGFKSEIFKYQNYDTHEIVDSLESRDMIICVARKV
jgi:2-polyprenyl-3-methyl-5-hydroxy-6-metoxy-1,4-benzoquinol methylase